MTKLKRTKTKKDKYKLKTRRMFSMRDIYKVILLQASAKTNHPKFHNVNCASSSIIYLMECILCNEQHLRQANFNITFNNHRKDVKKADAVMACAHFQ